MARFSPQWLDSPAAYSSFADRMLIRSLLPNVGVRGMVATVQSNTMNLLFGPGAAAVPLVDGDGSVHLATDGASESLTIATAPPSGQSRIDSVVARYNPTNGTWGWAANQGAATTGTPASPGPTAGTDAWLYDVNVPGGVAFLTAANLVDKRAAMIPGPTRPAGRVYATVNTSCPNNTNTFIGNLAADFLRGGMTLVAESPTPGNSALIVPTPGLYLVYGQIGWAGLATAGNVYGGIWQNGVNKSSLGIEYEIAGQFPHTEGTTLLVCNTGDYLQLSANQNTGSTETVGTGITSTFFFAALLG